MSKGIPERAQVVIIGGGIIGASVAYHLTKRGISDVLVLEQGQLTGGTTWHAAGLVSQLKSTYSLTKLATYSARLFEDLEAETGQATGYRKPGSISVAADIERWEELKRGISMASTVGVEIREIEMDELREFWPLVKTDDLVGALYIPDDGKDAGSLDVRVRANSKVLEILSSSLPSHISSDADSLIREMFPIRLILEN